MSSSSGPPPPSVPLHQVPVSEVIGQIRERPDSGIEHTAPDATEKLRAATLRGFPAPFRVSDTASSVSSGSEASSTPSVFKQRLLAARAKRQEHTAGQAPATPPGANAVWLADAGAAIGLEPTDVAALDAGNVARVAGMSSHERDSALDEVRGLLGDDLLRKWAARKAAAASAASTSSATGDVGSAAGGGPSPSPAVSKPHQVGPVLPKGPLDLSGIRTEEELDAAAAALLPASERAKLAWTGMFDAAGRHMQSSAAGAAAGGAAGSAPAAPGALGATDELAEYEWSPDAPALAPNANALSITGNATDGATDVDVGMDSLALRGTAASGTAQLFSLWARAAQQAAAAEDDDEHEDEQDEEGFGSAVPGRGQKIPPPEPLTTDTAMSQWASLKETLGLGAGEQGERLPSGVKLRVHPSARRLRFDLDGRLVRPGWDRSGHGSADVTALAVAAGLHHHGAEPDMAGYSLIEMLGLCRSSAAGQRALALRMLCGMLEGRRRAFIEPSRPRQESTAEDLDEASNYPWRYPGREWEAEAAALRGLLLPPALPVLLRLALGDPSPAVVRPALAALRAFAVGTAAVHGHATSDAFDSALSSPLIRPQPPVDEEGDSGRLGDGHTPQQLVQAIMFGPGRRANEPAAVQSLRLGRAALVDPISVLAHAGLAQQLVSILRRLADQGPAFRQAHMGTVAEVLRLLLACSQRSLTLATQIGRSAVIDVSVPGRSSRASVGLLPWLAHECLFAPSQDIRNGTAGQDVVECAVLTLQLLRSVCAQGRGLAEQLCDAGGVGTGLGKCAPSGSGLSVGPVQLDALLQFAPLQDTDTAPEVQLELLHLLLACGRYGLGLDRVSTLWTCHLVHTLEGGASHDALGLDDQDGREDEPIFRAIQHTVVQLVCAVARQAALVSHQAAAAKLAASRPVGHPLATALNPGEEEAQGEAAALCQQAWAMCRTVLSSPAVVRLPSVGAGGAAIPQHHTAGPPLDDIDRHTAALQLLAAYYAVPDGQAALITGLEASNTTSTSTTGGPRLRLLDEVLTTPDGKADAARDIVQDWLLPVIRTGLLDHCLSVVTSPASSGPETRSALAWLDAWARLACVAHGLHAESLVELAGNVTAKLLGAASSIVEWAHALQQSSAGSALPWTWWSACDPTGAGLGHSRASAHAATALLNLHMRLSPSSSLLDCVPVASRILGLLYPGDECLALQLVTDVLLAPAVLVAGSAEPGQAVTTADALGIRAGLMPVWTSILFRSPLEGGSAPVTEAASWPASARHSASCLHVLKPGLVSPRIRGVAIIGLETLRVRVADAIKLSDTANANGEDDGSGAASLADGGGVAELCLALPRPLRVAPGLPCSADHLAAASIACPLLLLGVADKLRSGAPGSALHGSSTQTAAHMDKQQSAMLLRPLGAAARWLHAVGAYRVLGYIRPDARASVVPGSSPAEHARRLAVSALSTAHLLFTLMHAPMADIDHADGQAVARAWLVCYDLFRQASGQSSAIDVLVSHPAAGLGVLQALTNGLINTLVGEGPGAAGGAVELAILALLLPQRVAMPHTAVPSAGQPPAVPYLRKDVWKALAACGVGHMVGDGLADILRATTQDARLNDVVNRLRSDLALPSSCSVEDREAEVACMAGMLTSDTLHASLEGGGMEGAVGIADAVDEAECRRRALAVDENWPVAADETSAVQDGPPGLSALHLAIAGVARALWYAAPAPIAPPSSVAWDADESARRVWERCALHTAHPRIKHLLLQYKRREEQE